jgi:hypothetical protein
MTRKAKELTLEEKAIKYEQQRLKQAQHCKNWVTKNREKLSITLIIKSTTIKNVSYIAGIGVKH